MSLGKSREAARMETEWNWFIIVMNLLAMLSVSQPNSHALISQKVSQPAIRL
jgi:hypothetical protein